MNDKLNDLFERTHIEIINNKNLPAGSHWFKTLCKQTSRVSMYGSKKNKRLVIH